MSQQSAGTFSCEHCGHRFDWKPPIAGKKARCVCGQVVVVPQDEPEAPEEYGPYELAEVPPMAVIPVEPEPLMYEPKPRDRFSAAVTTYLPRDVYAPAGLLVGSFLAMLLWATAHMQVPLGTLANTAFLAAVVTAIKTTLLITLALVAAPRIGVSFGPFPTATLKFVAIIIVIDAAILWLEVLMNNGGAWRSARAHARAVLISLLLACAIASFLCHYLFVMNRDETARVAFPLALLSRLLGFIVKILLGVALVAIYAPRVKSPAAAPPTRPAAAAPVPTPAVNPGSPADRALAEHIAQGRYVQESRRLAGQTGRSRGPDALAEHAYAAGARKVYLDLEDAMRGQPMKAYIELPADPPGRAACFAALVSICQDNRYTLAPASASDTGQRFLTVILGK